MRRLVDARGLTCPQPVVLTSKAIAHGDEVTTVVDNAAAVENVTRLARSKGYAVEVEKRADGFYLTLRKQGESAESTVMEDSRPTALVPAAIAGPTVLFVTSDSFGSGPAELGEPLMGVFFHTLIEVVPKPTMIIFANTGVKLAVEGSRAIDDLKTLAAQGVDILACGTCLSYFEITEKLAVGRVSNMYDIASALLTSGRLVKL
jgi:selenium metabolism protein YedF